MICHIFFGRMWMDPVYSKMGSRFWAWVIIVMVICKRKDVGQTDYSAHCRDEGFFWKKFLWFGIIL